MACLVGTLVSLLIEHTVFGTDKMDQSTFDFWMHHSVNFLEMAFQMDRRETLEHPDGYGTKTRECGDTVEIFLIVRDGKIQSAAFETNGCLYSVACANAITVMVEGRTLAEALEITPQTVVDFLETLPEDERHCADLAAEALHLAVKDVEKHHINRM